MKKHYLKCCVLFIAIIQSIGYVKAQQWGDYTL